jgi:hypothetical protein
MTKNHGFFPKDFFPKVQKKPTLILPPSIDGNKLEESRNPHAFLVIAATRTHRLFFWHTTRKKLDGISDGFLPVKFTSCVSNCKADIRFKIYSPTLVL